MSNLLIAYLLLVATIAVYGYLDIKKKPLKTATKFLWSINMKNADVTLSWVKSVSTDVVNQHLDVVVNGVSTGGVNLAPDIESLRVGIFAAGTVLTGTHTVADAAGNTAVVNLPSFTVPDLDNPMPATGFNWSYVVVEEDPRLVGPLH